jgi:hypothetical protein
MQYLHGGVTPTTCDCIESYCDGCWEHGFEAQFKQIETKLYIRTSPNSDTSQYQLINQFYTRSNDEIEQYEQLDEEIFVIDKDYEFRCPRCDKPFIQTEANKYGRDEKYYDDFQIKMRNLK